MAYIRRVIACRTFVIASIAKQSKQFKIAFPHPKLGRGKPSPYILNSQFSILNSLLGRGKPSLYVAHSQFSILNSQLIILILAACSTTRNIPAGELLYTGVKAIEYLDEDSVAVDDLIYDRIDAALASAPNNALLGSSSVRTPLPFGLWMYNATVNPKPRFKQMLLKPFAARPVFISAVNPAVRSGIVSGVLRDNGYFNSSVEYDVIHNTRDSLKAGIIYRIRFNQPYTLDSIEYRRVAFRTDTLFELDEAGRLLHRGDPFSTDLLEAERQRITRLMREKGYFYFQPEYIVFNADSTISPQKISLQATLKQGAPRSILRPWRIGSITINLSGYDGQRPDDSLVYKNLLLRYETKLRVKPSVLYDQIKFSTGDLYSLSSQEQTLEALNRLDVFRFTDLRFSPNDTVGDILNLRINTSYNYPLAVSFEAGATVNDNDYAGPITRVNISRNNFLGGGEVLTAGVYGSYEWYTRKFLNNTTGVINNYELGLKGSLLFPRLVLPRIGRRAYDFYATTHLDLNIALLNRAGYYRTLSFGGALSYDFQPYAIRHHSFTPLRLVFNKLESTTARFDEIVSFNPSLNQSLQDNFIPAIEYEYTLDNSSVREERSKTIWRFSVSEAGNIISGIYGILGRNSFKTSFRRNKIFGNTYSQYIRASTELRYNLYINRTNRLATRLGGGIIYSYGNSTVAPYNERFYVGGANSIRAFTIRSIGPGRFAPDPNNPYAYIDQNGDLKLEGNAEYRFGLVGDLEAAFFLDAGNVWLLRHDDTRPGGTFSWRHLFTDVALGTGLGFRYNMDLLIFRFDVGYALHFPYDTSRRGYFNTPSLSDALGFHLALGYPF
jgi:outer membrane protein assembly factor BamA